MNTYRKNAIVVGILFIACTAASIAGPLLAGSNLNTLDYLIQLASNPNQTVFAVLLEFIWAATGAGIAIGLYPILKKYSPGLALGSVGFRVVEGVLVLAGTISLLGLMSLGQEYISAGSAVAPAFQTSGTLLVAVRDWAQWTMGPLAFNLGALLYYAVLFQSKLIPRWLSGWGFAGALLGLGTTLFTAFNPGFSSESLHTILNLPIGLQEMFLAVWLIAKGFNSSAIVSLSARTTTNKPSNVS
jgi:hypothetical protein